MLAKISVSEYMTPHPVVFKPDMDVYEAIRKLLEIKSTGAPVVDDHGKVVGAFSELDCLRMVVNSSYYEDMGGKVSEFMTNDVTVVDSEASIVEVAELFAKSTLRHFPVIDEGKLVGVISRVDVLKALIAIR
ncbi:CBS domain-containing protein [Methyloterricola oryzae]|uniref:CBS domain-containing protein n=1 Tax=Methyloterricola oryzae TaxID=1495050 RepID=UPI0005EB7CA3|nr:CBS domain-containing protein [Methyloterricola oryzae]